ncbi:RNA-directed DNA polymerase from mobile element jockey-like protein [Pitangus sulphuratus]|nr:RNA-directed DNA polymerase from mobile element jockey-like protein [Pitangus sulphuratus]
MMGEGDMIVFERSWRSGELSEDWKKASVTPIFKKGKKKESGNYHPVSLTSIPGKVRKCILEAISIHIEDKKEIRSSQRVFTKVKSFLSNLIAFYDDTTTWMDKGRTVDIAYLYFSKAFDAVSH